MQKIQKENLMNELVVALKDVFVAEVAQNENVLTVKFVNGQKFSLQVEEI